MTSTSTPAASAGTQSISSTEDKSSMQDSTTSSTTSPQKTPLALPPSSDSSVPTQLDVSGDGTSIKLDNLGPMVVNTDGTMSRIANWAEMADVERKNTLRVLGKRNQERLRVLRGES